MNFSNGLWYVLPDKFNFKTMFLPTTSYWIERNEGESAGD